MNSKCIIMTSPSKGNAEVVYNNDQLIFLSKPRWAVLVFGLIGHALAPLKERFRINTSDITSIVFSRTMTGNLVYEFKMKNNEIFKIGFRVANDFTTKLDEDFKDIIVTEQ